MANHDLPSDDPGDALADDIHTIDTLKLELEDVRQQYRRATLGRDHLAEDPFEQFDSWLAEARTSGDAEPTACALATAAIAGSEAQPSVRMVLLKGVDKRGLRFFTNYDSRKGQELEVNPLAALCFFWPKLERQVRVEGRVSRVSREESAEYFDSRPEGSQLSAASSPQSCIVASRQELVTRWSALAQAEGDLELPDNWGGYRLAPSVFEFWQGRPDRLHDRFRFRVSNNAPGVDSAWVLERLAP